MKVGLIGAGNWGRNILRTLAELGVLGGVAEASGELRQRIAAEHPGTRVYADHRELLCSDIPAVAIATPVATHYPIAREALLAGKDVFVEKPLALRAAEAEELVELARARGRVLMVGHLLLYQPAIGWIKDFLGGGGIGEVYSLHQERLNLGRVRTVENALWSLGVHDVAVALYLVGRAPTRVEVVGQCALQPGIEDDVYLHMGFPGGVQAHLHASWLWPERRRRLTVVGSKGMIVFDELEGTVIVHRKGITPALGIRDEGSDVVFRAYGEPLRSEIEDFIRCIRDRATPVSDGECALAVVRVLEQTARQMEAR